MDMSSGNGYKSNHNNLISLSREQSLLEERRICELHELSVVALDRLFTTYGIDMDAYEMLSLLSDEQFLTDVAIHSGAMVENSDRLTAFLDRISESDRIVFCDLLNEELTLRGFNISESDFLRCDDAPETFIYVKNALADEAYDVFSQEFTDPRVVYESSIKSAVGAVVDGLKSYCLVPLEESGGSRLHTVDELIFSCDLKISAVTPVFGFDGTADMRYALLSRAFRISPPTEEDDRYLEIRIPAGEETSLSELLSASESFGHSLYRVNTSTLGNEDGQRAYYSLVIRDEGREFTRFLTYLTLFTGSFVAVGVYKNLE